MNGITAEELMDCWEASGSAYDAQILTRLWASVPPEMRLPRLSADAVPGRYRGGFAEGGRQREVVDVGALPGPMHQVTSWRIGPGRAPTSTTSRCRPPSAKPPR